MGTNGASFNVVAEDGEVGVIDLDSEGFPPRVIWAKGVIAPISIALVDQLRKHHAVRLSRGLFARPQCRML